MTHGGPDPAGRRLRIGRTGALGLVFTDRLPYAFDDEAAVLFLRGVANALENSGAGLLLIPTSPTREEGSRVVRGAVRNSGLRCYVIGVAGVQT